VAVLPFLDLSETKDQQYFADGMTEELIDHLANVATLKVPARTSSFYFKDNSKPIPEIARTLGVANVLEGSVRKSGDHIRVTVQLVRADTGYHLWSKTYERNVRDIFAIQDEIATATVSALKLTLQPDLTPRPPGVRNIAAYNLYLQGRSMYRAATTLDSAHTATELLQRAIDADPQYAPAWVVLSAAKRAEAQYLSDAMVAHSEKREAALRLRRESQQAVERALKLDPQSSQAHSVLANLLFDAGDWAPGEKEIRRALELDPNNGHALAWAGDLAMARGQIDHAIEIYQKAISIDPVSSARHSDLVDALIFAGRYAAALEEIQMTPAWTPLVDAHAWKVQILYWQGNYGAALTELDQESNDGPRYIEPRVLLYDALGRHSEADQLLASLEKDYPDEYGYDIACIYATRGNIGKSLAWLRRGNRWEAPPTLFARVDPELKNIRDDPRFEALWTELNLPR